MSLQVLLALAGVLALLAGCVTGEDEARRAVESAGFRDVRIGSTSFWACSADDKVGRKFFGLNAQGVPASGVVCCGTFKGCTVRF